MNIMITGNIAHFVVTKYEEKIFAQTFKEE
jgi:hypothetical protein